MQNEEQTKQALSEAKRMAQLASNKRLTKEPTPAGKSISVQDTIDLFAALVPDSPWSDRLKKIGAIFDDMATAVVLLNSMKHFSLAYCVHNVMEHEGKGGNGPEVVQFKEAINRIEAAFARMRPVERESASLPPMPTPVPKLRDRREFLFAPANDKLSLGQVNLYKLVLDVGADIDGGDAGDPSVGLGATPPVFIFSEQQLIDFATIIDEG